MFSALDIALKATLSRWWNAQEKNTGGWQECQRLMGIRLEQIHTEMEIEYHGETNPRKHIQLCTTMSKEVP